MRGSGRAGSHAAAAASIIIVAIVGRKIRKVGGRSGRIEYTKVRIVI